MLSLFQCGVLLDFGNNIKKNISPANSVKTLNNTLSTAISAVGIIIIVYSIVKIILSFLDENPKGKADATISLGVGIFLAAVSGVIKALGIENLSSSGLSGIVNHALSVLASMLSYSGAILVFIAIFYLILSIAQEDAEKQSKGSIMLMVAIGLISIGTFTTGLTGTVNLLSLSQAAGNTPSIDTKKLIQDIISYVKNVVTWGGGGILIIGIFRLVLSIKEDDSRGRESAAKFLLVAIALISFAQILRLFGFTVG